MIRKNLLNFKLNFSFYSAKSRFLSFMKSFDPQKETCPSCGAKGQCRIYASYERYIVDLNDGKVVSEKIRITRVRCTCGHTHAILPDLIIPYRQYSLPFILYILNLWSPDFFDPRTFKIFDAILTPFAEFSQETEKGSCRKNRQDPHKI